MPQVILRVHGQGHQNHDLHWQRGGTTPFQPPRFQVSKMPKVPTRGRGQGQKMQNSSAARGLRPLRTPALTGGHHPLKFPPYSLFRPKGGQKTINFFSHVHQLVPDANYKHLDSLVQLGTDGEPRRDECHIYVTSVVKGLND